jgi:hypothetical protein
MPAHAYSEDQQAQRTLTRPLPEGEESEQPAKANGLPSPRPSPRRRGSRGLFAEFGLIKRLAVICRKCLVYNGFVFKWKTSR